MFYQRKPLAKNYHIALVSPKVTAYIRADSRFAPSQWETSLPSNIVSHRLGAKLEPALLYDGDISRPSRCHPKRLPCNYIRCVSLQIFCFILPIGLLYSLYLYIYDQHLLLNFITCWWWQLLKSIIAVWFYLYANIWIHNEKWEVLVSIEWYAKNNTGYYIHATITHVKLTHPRHWPLWGESTSDWWIFLKRPSNAEKMFPFDDVIMIVIFLWIHLIFYKYSSDLINKSYMGKI